MTNFGKDNFNENKEKPQFLYHGSPEEIEKLEPRNRFTPGGADVPSRIYAADNPAIAAAHAFKWTSNDGIDLSETNGKIILKVPELLKDRLEKKVYIYKLNADSFDITTEERTGHTYHSEEKMESDEVSTFNSVTEAIEYYGGKVEII